MYNPPNEMNLRKRDLFKEFENDFTYYELNELLIEGKIKKLQSTITPKSTPDIAESTQRRIVELQRELEDVRKLL